MPAICLPHHDGEIPLRPFQTAQQVNLPACSPHCPFDAERQVGKLRTAILQLLVDPSGDQIPVYSFRGGRSYHSAI